MSVSDPIADMLTKVRNAAMARHEKASRSRMNVTFRTGNDELDKKFIQESIDAGMTNLKGHRLVGGMRASIYNAMPIEGVEYLIDFMKKFENNNK